MPEAIKLKLSVDGAAEAKKAVEDVTKSTEDLAKAEEASKRRVQEAVEARRAANKAHAEAQAALRAEAAEARELAAATEKSTAATIKDAEGMSVFEKQAKRAADQVERLALAKGKGADKAAELADATFEKVRGGASTAHAVWEVKAAFDAESKAAREAAAAQAVQEAALKRLENQALRTGDAVRRMAVSHGKSAADAAELADIAANRVRGGERPADVAWKTKGGLAAEASALRDIAAESAPAAAGMGKVAASAASATEKTQGLVSAGRLMANAFLPDMWVSRTLSVGRALVGVLSAMSVAALGVGAVVGGVLAAAFYKFFQAQKENREAGEKLNKTLEEQARLAENAADRHEMLRRDLGGGSLENAAKSYYALSRETEQYANSLRRANDELAANLEAESARIALSESVDLAAIRKQFAPGIAAARKEAADARRAETAVGLEFDAKIRSANSPEEAAALAAQRDDAKARERERAEVARERLGNLEADQADAVASARAKAALDKAKAEADAAAKAVPLANEEAARARAGLVRDEFDTTKLQGARDDYLGRIKALPGAQLRERAAILNAVDKSDRDKAITDQIKLLEEVVPKARAKDDEIADLEGSWFTRPATKRLNLAKLRAERAELGDPAKSIELLKNYGEAANKTESADSTLRETREKVLKLEAAAKLASAKAEIAKASLDVAKANADMDTADRASAASERSTATSSASAARASEAENRKALNAAGDDLGRRAHATIALNSAEDFGLSGTNADAFDALRPHLAKADRALTDGETNRADIARFADVLRRLVALAEQSHEQGKSLRSALDPLQARLANLEALSRNAPSR